MFTKTNFLKPFAPPPLYGRQTKTCLPIDIFCACPCHCHSLAWLRSVVLAYLRVVFVWVVRRGLRGLSEGNCRDLILCSFICHELRFYCEAHVKAIQRTDVINY
ncbi:unnamed protein product [Acanthocheilonema viteae]|uniref:Uncharacterized protein n=1 Tax=Acanthocheilonema viteae TaxID=6277 RepID=A0A498SCM0_ACAVI|nr:unnamed protein product [Acanthocheilonema viteae]